MAIQKVGSTYVISSHRVWRPGVFADERAARYALTWCSDEDINTLMDRGRVIFTSRDEMERAGIEEELIPDLLENPRPVFMSALTFEELRQYRREQATEETQ